MRYIHSIVLISVLLSCGNHKDSTVQNAEKKVTPAIDSTKTATLESAASKKDLVTSMIEKIPEINLPFYWDQNSSFKTVSSQAYSIVIPKYDVIGYIDLKDKYAILQLFPADELIPHVTVIDKNGEKLDSKSIIIGKCHGDCSYECNESTKINKDLTIYAVFNSVFQECEGTGDIDPLKAKASVQEGFGEITNEGIINFIEEDPKIYKPDSAEVASLGYNSEVFQIIDHDYVETLKIKQVNDSTINYWIHSDNDLCEFSYYATATKICPSCDAEVGEYKGEKYHSFEYLPNGKVDVIGSIHIAQDYTKALLKGQEKTVQYDCMPWLNTMYSNKRR